MPSDVPTVLAEVGSFQCFLVTAQHKIQLKKFLGPAFALEPLNTHLGPDGQRASTQFIDYIVEQYADNGYCVAVRDTQSMSLIQNCLTISLHLK